MLECIVCGNLYEDKDVEEMLDDSLGKTKLGNKNKNGYWNGICFKCSNVMVKTSKRS